MLHDDCIALIPGTRFSVRSISSSFTFLLEDVSPASHTKNLLINKDTVYVRVALVEVSLNTWYEKNLSKVRNVFKNIMFIYIIQDKNRCQFIGTYKEMIRGAGPGFG